MIIQNKNVKLMQSPKRNRRRGIAVIYVALGLTIFIGAAALGVDMSFMHYKRAEAQKAADAAALAGALNMDNSSQARQQAIRFARLNGYDNGTSSNTTNPNAPVYIHARPDETNPNSQYTVTVKRLEPLFFAYVLGLTSKYVGATATAEAQAPVNIDISGDTTYGSATGKMNLAVFGPYAKYEHGDAYSPLYLNDGTTPNPDYQADGYSFAVNIPADYITRNGTSEVSLDIFDPDSYNADDMPVPQHGVRIDEYQAGFKGRTALTPTVTQYTLYKPDGDVLATASYGHDTTTDMKWVTPAGFKFDLNTLGLSGAQTFIIKVKTTEGSSENGFTLRAGPPDATTGSTSGAGTFDPTNGTSITANGRLPFNFNADGDVSIKLGSVPGSAAGGQLSIHKFDTDVGAQTINYTTSSLPGESWPGILTGNGQWNYDYIDLPNNYQTGQWLATYTAGLQDTTVWEMTYTGVSSTPGNVKLVR